VTDAERAELRALIGGRIAEAEAAEASASATEAAATVTLDQQSVGRLSRIDALQGQAMAQETARRRAVDLVRIDAALARLDAGTYG
jgi:DnaK suppressor protein